MKEEKLGHLRVPTDAQKSEWATRTHVVSKKDDSMGRWICDFRPLNRVTKKRMTAIGDAFRKTRALASKMWKSGLDAYSGFNQMEASERASRLLQIITSFGVRQWTVLPFGVTNGPPYFQEMMLDLYSGQSINGSEKLPDLLGTNMSDVDASLEIWVDDLQLGTGSMSDVAAREIDSSQTNKNDGFAQHVVALTRILARARVVGLRFKLDKCFFAQFSIETLGMIAGCGVVAPDPKKNQGIIQWPRPSRLEDVEKFLATTVFIREHLSPRYSHVTKPLRDLLCVLHSKRKEDGKKCKARYLPPPKVAAA